MRTTLLVGVLVVSCVCLALGRPQQSAFIPILSRYESAEPAGTYRSVFESANGIRVDEQGYEKPTNDGLDKVIAKQGGYSFTTPEGLMVQVVYVADERGFQPQGNVIPQPVQPIPAVFT